MLHCSIEVGRTLATTGKVVADSSTTSAHVSYLAAPEGDAPAWLETYLLDTLDQVDPERKRPIVVVIPGGAYQRMSAREAEPVAMRFLAHGYHAAVLHYSVAPHVYPRALEELASAVAWLRLHADKYHLDPARIILCGFSAGGHLACNLGCDWQQPWLSEQVGCDGEQMRPDGLILGYPVITSGVHAHARSFELLTGGDAHLAQELSLERHVTSAMPPTFLFHTLEDASVPVENSLLLAEAMRESGVPFELHVFPHGGHGLALANTETARADKDGQVQPLMQCWPDLAIAWVESLA